MKETKIRNYTGASCWQTWRVGDLCLIRSLSWNEFIWKLWKIKKNNRGKLQKINHHFRKNNRARLKKKKTTMRIRMVENLKKKKTTTRAWLVEN